LGLGITSRAGTPMTRLRVGVVGAGFIARRHVGNLAAFADVEVVGIADVDPSAAAALAATCGARPYAGHDELLGRERVDALYVCVPPFAHGEVERQAIDAGIPLFVEKPLAIDLATAEEIADRVSARGLVTATGYHWRYLDTVELVAELFSTRPAHLALGYWLDVMPPPLWWSRRSGSGGQLVEQTTHVFDLARLLVGEVTSVRAEGRHVERAAGDTGRDDAIFSASIATLRFASGALGTIASTCLLCRPHRIGLHVFGDGLVAEVAEHEVVVDVGDGPVVHRATVDPFVREDRDFLDAVAGRPDRIRVPYNAALPTHRLALAAAQAADEGTTIDLVGVDHG
jgi:predicted dehydrogenase